MKGRPPPATPGRSPRRASDPSPVRPRAAGAGPTPARRVGTEAQENTQGGEGIQGMLCVSTEACARLYISLAFYRIPNNNLQTNNKQIAWTLLLTKRFTFSFLPLISSGYSNAPTQQQ